MTKPPRSSFCTLCIFVLLAALACTASAQQPAVPTATTSAPSTAVPAEPAPLSGTFFSRLTQAYHQDWFGPASTAPAPPRRGQPSPLDSSPFPESDWCYGSSPVIGEPDTTTYPLMSAINGAASRSKIYGWIAPSVNGSTSSHSNAPASYDVYANRLELNQAVLFAERLPDTVQTSHLDWGYHLTALYGTDYRFTTGKGYLSSQLLDHNHQYGFDPLLEYLDLYLPHLGQGMNIRVGRFASIPGIEAPLAPGNYAFSHSLVYGVSPTTDTGILATLKLTDHWLLQLGLTGGHDVALWTSDAKPSATACVSYTTSSVNDNLYACANGINDGKYAYNNLQQYDLTWYHKFSKSIHIATEAWYMYQREVPALGGPIQPQTNTNAAHCLPGQIHCTAPEYAVDNYLQKELSPHNFVSFRTDFLNDKKGQRTGYATRYSENTILWTHWIGSTIQFRPELRFEHAWDAQPYDNGKHPSQFTAAADLIYHF